MEHVNARRGFLTNGAALGLALVGCSLAARAQSSAPAGAAVKEPPPLEKELVRAFVGAAHTDLAKTKALLAQQPRLINATWDWGEGDFETALGGASHMGAREIGLFLVERGARLDIFAATMLGRIDIVRASFAAFPRLIDTPGPHGIPLIEHAEAGGSEAAEVLAFLKSLR